MFVFACDDNSSSVLNKKPIVVDLQPFSDITSEQLKFIHQELHKIYPRILIRQPIDMPPAAYYKERNRYRADTILRFLRSRAREGHLIIALTNKDISHTKGAVKDYGIMGLGLCPGNACVASSFRVSKEDHWSQFFKVAIHELGHTQGLPHCPVKICFMRDAKGKNPTDEEKEFCSKCKAHLIARGWAL
ncbi:MAG: matrixin family metalloprotease [Bacteroidota bacterium]